MNVRHLIGVLHSFSIKSIFYDKKFCKLALSHHEALQHVKEALFDMYSSSILP